MAAGYLRHLAGDRVRVLEDLAAMRRIRDEILVRIERLVSEIAPA